MNGMTDSHELLSQYARQGSESAFHELVARYFDLVYSTALRRVGGDAHLAEDVAQTVFLHLAKKAPKLRKGVILGGWLHEATCNVAGTVVRYDRRRLAREKEAVLMNTLDNDSTNLLAHVAPMLDEALGQLSGEDRYAVLLRFFELIQAHSTCDDVPPRLSGCELKPGFGGKSDHILLFNQREFEVRLLRLRRKRTRA